MEGVDDLEHGGRASEDRPGVGLYRLDSNQSHTSIFEDVEMAHDEVGDLQPRDARLAKG